ncbi:MAG: hypothetical protein C4345_04585 [Chloroflexota bacterium]
MLAILYDATGGLVGTSKGIPWTGEAGWALASMILVNVWKGVPFFTLLALAGLKSIDSELYDAAAVDGANAWQRFLAVTLPSIRQVILIVVLLSSIWTANSFENIWIMTQGGPSDATMVFPVLAYFGMQSQRLGEAAAVSVAMVPVLALLVIIVTTLMREDEA